jgi:hypothetical protein
VKVDYLNLHDVMLTAYHQLTTVANMKPAVYLAFGAQFARHAGGLGNWCLKPGRNPGQVAGADHGSDGITKLGNNSLFVVGMVSAVVLALDA